MSDNVEVRYGYGVACNEEEHWFVHHLHFQISHVKTESVLGLCRCNQLVLYDCLMAVVKTQQITLLTWLLSN